MEAFFRTGDSVYVVVALIALVMLYAATTWRSRLGAKEKAQKNSIAEEQPVRTGCFFSVGRRVFCAFLEKYHRKALRSMAGWVRIK